MLAFFSDYSWIEVWGPFHLAVVIFLVYMYHRKVIHSPYRTTKRQAAYFYTAMALTYIVLGSPFSVIASHYLFSAHIVQLSSLFFVVSPLVILSLPYPFLRGFFWDRRRKHLIQIFGHPWLNLFIFNGLLTIYIAPGIFNILKDVPVLLYLTQIVLVVNGLLMWWVILAPMPEMNQLTYLKRIIYTFLAAFFLMPIGFYLIIVVQEHYPAYASVAGDLIPGLTAIYDQQLAGGLLKLFQLSSFCIAIFYILRQWNNQEDEHEGDPYDENIRVVQGIPIRIDPKNKK